MKLWIDRKRNRISLVTGDGRFVFEKLPMRCGQRGFESTSWVTGKSPIPYSHEVMGKYWLHLTHLNKNGEAKPITTKRGGIGWFLPISNSVRDPFTIDGLNIGEKRTFIGLHPENDNPRITGDAYEGSAGCPVLVIDTKTDRALISGLFETLITLRESGTKVIEVEVV